MKSLQSAYCKVPTFVTLVRFLSLSGLLISIAPPNCNIHESINLKLHIPQMKLLIFPHLWSLLYSQSSLPWLMASPSFGCSEQRHWCHLWLFLILDSTLYQEIMWFLHSICIHPVLLINFITLTLVQAMDYLGPGLLQYSSKWFSYVLSCSP